MALDAPEPYCTHTAPALVWYGVRRSETKNPAKSGVLAWFRDRVRCLETLRWCPGEDSNLHDVTR
jgi:hypothetical protein